MRFFKRRLTTLGLVLLVSACATQAPPANSLTVEALRQLPEQSYSLQPGDAVIEFAARPIAFSAVRGTFSEFGGEVRIVKASADRIDVRAEVDLASVDMDNPTYENLVKSEGWFDVVHHPKALFVGTLDGWSGEGAGVVTGLMTIRGITRPAEFSILLNCETMDRCPADTVGFTGAIAISRSEFGMNAWRGLVRDEVQLNFTGALVGGH